MIVFEFKLVNFGFEDENSVDLIWSVLDLGKVFGKYIYINYFWCLVLVNFIFYVVFNVVV